MRQSGLISLASYNKNIYFAKMLRGVYFMYMYFICRYFIVGTFTIPPILAHFKLHDCPKQFFSAVSRMCTKESQVSFQKCLNRLCPHWRCQRCSTSCQKVWNMIYHEITQFYFIYINISFAQNVTETVLCKNGTSISWITETHIYIYQINFISNVVNFLIWPSNSWIMKYKYILHINCMYV